MSTGHTAVPWALVEHELFSGAKVIGGVKDVNGDSIRVTGFALSGGDVSEANSHFIVRACNAHDELVEAVEAFLKYDDNDHSDGAAMMIDYADALRLAKSALAKATA